MAAITQIGSAAAADFVERGEVTYSEVLCEISPEDADGDSIWPPVIQFDDLYAAATAIGMEVEFLAKFSDFVMLGCLEHDDVWVYIPTK